MRKHEIIKIKDPFSVDLYAVAEVSPDGKPRRILFKDVYLSVCKEYLKKMKETENDKRRKGKDLPGSSV